MNTRNKKDFISYMKVRRRNLGCCIGKPNLHRISQITHRTYKCFNVHWIS